MRKLSDVLKERNAELISTYRRVEAGEVIELPYVPTGLPSLDAVGLLEKGILTAIAGHPGDGKSALALQLLKAASEYGYSPVGFFFEDPLKFIADRVTASSTGESAFRLRRYQVEDIVERLEAVAGKEEWTEHVKIDDELKNSKQLIEWIDKNVTEETGLVIVDYAQSLDSEDDEKSVERVIARLAWGLNQLAKKKNIAIVLFSQVKKEVSDRGKLWFKDWCWKNNGQEPKASDLDCVEGYRPLSNDMQWSTALQQRSKQIVFIFRPGSWMRSHGIVCNDDEMQMVIAKGNYGSANELLRFHWYGPTTTISERKRKGSK